MNTASKSTQTVFPGTASSGAELIRRSLAWIDRNLAATLATTLIFVSSASLFSLLEAFQ